MSALDQYIKKPPNSSQAKDLFAEMLKELETPAPATRTIMFPEFDKLVGGFRPKEFSILCGGTGVGKTSLLANWSAAFIATEVPHFVASVETGHTDFMKRTASVLLDRDINRGQAIPMQEIAKIDQALRGAMGEAKKWLSLHDNRFSVEELMSDIAWHVKHHGVKVAMIDNLNFFLDVTSHQESIVEMDRVLHELIIFCKRVDVHLVMVMHPKKTDTEEVNSVYDIKGSSTAVQEAHNVFLWNRVDPEGKVVKPKTTAGMVIPTVHDRLLKIAKMRRIGIAVGTEIMYRIPRAGGAAYKEVAIGKKENFDAL